MVQKKCIFAYQFNISFMQNINVYYEMFENVINSFGIDPVSCRGEQEGQWNLQKGSAPVWVDIYSVDNGTYGYIQIMSPIYELPEVGYEEILTEALEVNHNLFGCGITKFNNWLYVKGIRELEDLSEKEIIAMINRIGNYADQYDDHFKNKFSLQGGGRL